MQGLTSPKAPLGGGASRSSGKAALADAQSSYQVHAYIRGSKELDVDLAAALRRLGGAGDLLGVLLVATPHRATAVRGEAAVLALGALCATGGWSAMMQRRVEQRAHAHEQGSLHS